jgi:hypothetical protein
MTAVDTRRAGRFWWIAMLVLPLVNPVLLVVVTWLLGGGESLGFVGVALWIAIANGVFLWRLSRGVWPVPGQRARRVGIGLATTVVLSVTYGMGELFVYLMIACGGGGCFS